MSKILPRFDEHLPVDDDPGQRFAHFPGHVCLWPARGLVFGERVVQRGQRPTCQHDPLHLLQHDGAVNPHPNLLILRLLRAPAHRDHVRSLADRRYARDDHRERDDPLLDPRPELEGGEVRGVAGFR